MNQDLVSINEQSVALHVPEIDILTLKVKPVMGQDGIVSSGMFREEITGTKFERMDTVYLKMTQNRSFFPDADSFEKGTLPLCRSNDGLFPIKDNPKLLPQCERCVDGNKPVCQHAQWGKYSNGKPKGPACAQGFTYIFTDLTSGLVFLLRGKRGSYGNAMKLEKALSMSVKISTAFGKPIQKYEFYSPMKVQVIKSGGKARLDVVFGDPVRLDSGDPKIEHFAALSSAVNSYRYTQEPTQESEAVEY